MFPSFLITLREGLEAALLIGLVFAVLARVAAPGGRRWTWAGVAAATAVSVSVGAVMFAVGAELEGAAEEVVEGVAMLVAAAVLAWMIVWMGRRAHLLSAEIHVRVSAAGSAAALFWLSFVLVVREGLESALFLFAAGGKASGGGAVLGGLAGLAMAAGLGYAVYRGGSRLNVRAFFTLLNVLLLGFAAFMVWRGAGELGELAVGGEAGELLGPLAAAAYAAVMIWVMVRERRRPVDSAGRGDRSTGEVRGSPLRTLR